MTVLEFPYFWSEFFTICYSVKMDCTRLINKIPHPHQATVFWACEQGYRPVVMRWADVMVQLWAITHQPYTQYCLTVCILGYWCWYIYTVNWGKYCSQQNLIGTEVQSYWFHVPVKSQGHIRNSYGMNTPSPPPPPPPSSPDTGKYSHRYVSF